VLLSVCPRCGAPLPDPSKEPTHSLSGAAKAERLDPRSMLAALGTYGIKTDRPFAEWASDRWPITHSHEDDLT
jgi:hypothetical protein